MSIKHGWAEANLEQLWLPVLRRRVTVHRKAADAFLSMWAEWARQGLLGGEETPGAPDGRALVISYNGTWVPRFKRQSGTYDQRVQRCRTLGAQSLSQHAWGTAVDLNAAWNGLGREPAALGKTGCVRELVPVAEAHGFFWGGNFRTRKDGMHMEYTGNTTRIQSVVPAALDLTPAAAAASELLKGAPLRRERVRELQAAVGEVLVDGINGPSTKARARRVLRR